MLSMYLTRPRAAFAASSFAGPCNINPVAWANQRMNNNQGGRMSYTPKYTFLPNQVVVSDYSETVGDIHVSVANPNQGVFKHMGRAWGVVKNSLGEWVIYGENLSFPV